MKKLRIGALSALVLLCAALLGSMAAASAAAPAAHVTAYMQNIYVDGQEAKFANAEGKTTYLFSYNGTVYMPANTAAKWLGCTLSVDRAAGRPLLPRDRRRRFRGRTAQCRQTKLISPCWTTILNPGPTSSCSVNSL